MTSTTDKRMLAFREMLKQTRRIRFYYEYDDEIGTFKSTISDIRNGRKGVHFTVEQINKTVNHFGANANYLFGVSDEPFRKTC
ncbi:hypothetical protein FCL53_17160 [Elizabethkingia meningoseptica]|uniref:hypothetical protein n=1 Tax=Elizabethkingia meningoseptica TaxID=238 RepID=UPI001366062E|nr:hypothetical protein [Elizabethkingia meningoseptica]MVW93694.1 hypothetical protein [Elizabethkingia meningoseptica]